MMTRTFINTRMPAQVEGRAKQIQRSLIPKPESSSTEGPLQTDERREGSFQMTARTHCESTVPHVCPR